jgi:hypothetical protein
MANAKEIVSDVHKVLAGISTGVVGIFGGQAAAQGIQTASGAVQGMLEKYVPNTEEEQPPSSKSPVPPSSKSPAPPVSKSPASEPSRVARFDRTDFNARTARDLADEKHEQRMKELRAQLSAARVELAAQRAAAANAAESIEIADLNPTEKRQPLVNDARNARAVKTPDGSLILDLGPMAKQTDATLTVDYLRTLGYSESEIDGLLAGPRTGSAAPARTPIAFKTLEIYGQAGDRMVPLIDAIEKIGGRWRPREGMAVKVAHSGAQGFGLKSIQTKARASTGCTRIEPSSIGTPARERPASQPRGSCRIYLRIGKRR